jgi:hypothetical protein
MGFERGAVGIEDNVRELCPGDALWTCCTFRPLPSLGFGQLVRF